jgi:hypothetical protein
VIKSHIAKICEKAILAKIKKGKGYLLQTGNYQRGCKENYSTLNNLTEVVGRISLQRKLFAHRKLTLFIDLQKSL